MVGVNRIAARSLACILAGAAAACASQPGLYDDMPRLRLGTRITLASMCTGSQSPAMSIGNVPATTSQYRVRMTNTGVLLQKPVEWTIPVPAEPTRIPLGALPGYAGPCPGDLQQVTYRFEVLALGRSGEPLGYGRTSVRVRSVNELAQQTWRRAGRGPVVDPTEPPGFEPEWEELFDPRRNRSDEFFDSERERERNEGPLPVPGR